MEYIGTITKVHDTDFKGTILWSFQIDTAEGTWFRTGTERPPVEEGDAVKFTWAGGTAKVKDITKTSAEEAEKATATASKSAPKTAGVSRNDYWTQKAQFEQTMQPVWDWGRSRSDAATVVAAAISSGALEFPKSANAAKRLALLVSYVHEVTGELREKEEKLKLSHDVRAGENDE